PGWCARPARLAHGCRARALVVTTDGRRRVDVMPEGDTLHRAAARLAPALEGQPLRRFEAPRLVGTRPRPGDVIERVEAVGKHLLVRFGSGLVLQTHLRMTGSWHLYRDGERWAKPAHLARVVLGAGEW